MVSYTQGILNKQRRSALVRQFLSPLFIFGGLVSVYTGVKEYADLDAIPSITQKTDDTIKKQGSQTDPLNVAFWGILATCVGIKQFSKSKKMLRGITQNKTMAVSVSSEVLDKLIYPKKSEQTTDFMYRSLNKTDLIRFCEMFNLSTLTPKEQRETLQMLLDVSEKEPFLRSFIRTPIPYTNAYFNINKLPESIENMAFLEQNVNSCCFYQKIPVRNIAFFFHEWRHIQQFNNKSVMHYTSLSDKFGIEVFSEAETKGYDTILSMYETHKTTAGPIMDKKHTALFMDAFTAYNYQQLQNDPQKWEMFNLSSKTEVKQQLVARAEAFQNMVGVVMRLLLEENPQMRQKFLESTVDKFFVQTNIISPKQKRKFLNQMAHINTYCDVWQKAYLHPFNTTSKKDTIHVVDLQTFNEYLDYYSQITKINLSGISIGKKKNTVFNLLHQQAASYATS
ncbi:MAG: hypothetical protein IJO11_03860 [Alphaproteobacteria bacterium]|mgnify:CR=1 FL=1|nr:hypothetical protein [Alphaproteobacteria bacterium]